MSDKGRMQMSVIQRLKRCLLSAVGFGLLEEDSPDQNKLLSDLNANLQKLKSAAVKVIAHQYHIERLLSLEKQKFADIEKRLAEAELNSSEELLTSLRLHRDNCRVQVENLEAQLEVAKAEAAMARDQLELFESELDDISRTVRESRVRSSTYSDRIRIEKSLLESVSEKDLVTLERMKEQADIAKAEAEARAELRDALGLFEGRSDI